MQTDNDAYAHYSKALAKMQDEHSQVETALKQQVAALTRNNKWFVQTNGHEPLLMTQLLEGIQQNGQDYWAIIKKIAEAKTQVKQYQGEIETLRMEVKAQMDKAEAAETTSNNFELMLVVTEEALEEEKVAAHYKKELEELKQRAERFSCSSPTTVSSRSTTDPTVTPVKATEAARKPAQMQQRRIRKRKLSLLEEESAAADVTSSDMHKSKKLRSSPVETSTTLASAEISPESASAVTFECPPSIDMRNVTGRSNCRQRHYRKHQMESRDSDGVQELSLTAQPELGGLARELELDSSMASSL